MKTKEKIVYTSIDLFNKSGVVAITTNHIAKELNSLQKDAIEQFRDFLKDHMTIKFIGGK